MVKAIVSKKSAKKPKGGATIKTVSDEKPVAKETAPKRASGSLSEGSTRSRLFRCLHKFPGLSAKEIKERTGMLPNSGHLAVLLGEECENGRLRYEEHPETGSNRSVFLYFLTAKGNSDLGKDQLESRKAGGRIGKKWSKARREAT